MLNESLVPISAVSYFQIKLEAAYLKPKENIHSETYLLPDTSFLCAQESFAKVFFGWNAEGLTFFVSSDQAFERVCHPDISSGDSIELLIDTRDVKTSGYNTRFCHHFFFLPKSVDGHQAAEITQFRTEDTHELCDPNKLKVKSRMHRHSYSCEIHIPAECLYSFDPHQFNRIGFTYRINRPHAPSQQFSVVDDDYFIEQQPSLWSSIELIT